MGTPEKTIERLSMYRRLLRAAAAEGQSNVYSHELAEKVGGTAAQVRRDLMEIGFGGSPKTGYEVRGLISKIGEALDNPDGESVLLVGVGNLGRALLHFFMSRHEKLAIVAAIDNDRNKIGRVICGCRCYALDELEAVVTGKQIRVAILALPADYAQAVTERLVAAGVTGLLNFAQGPLRLPKGVAVENIDMTMALEKVVCMARH